MSRAQTACSRLAVNRSPFETFNHHASWELFYPYHSAGRPSAGSPISLPGRTDFAVGWEKTLVVKEHPVAMTVVVP
jgi:hypothetical protein